ncbi:MAG: DUF6531 domain-containing protein, partial [Desulfobacterales bacterium]|nr:DUF6531 domain-containing protein [Desulfobacterales bacterium]
MRILKKIQCLLAFLTISFIFTLPPVWASTGGLPDDDDLRRTMECDWAITNTTEPVDPGDYNNDPDDDLVKLALSLDKDPAKLYAWVYKNVYFPQYQYDIQEQYNNLPFTYYNNSRLGARGAYLNNVGNTWDQSSLLIALLRISGIPARYVRIGTTQKVYVEAYLDLEKYYGIPAGGTKDWVPMIPWFKKIELFDGIDLYPTDGTVTDTVPTGLKYNFTDYLSTLKTESTLDEYESQLQDYLVANYPGKSIKDISYRETRIDRPAIIPPRSLPLGFSSKSENRFAEIPDSNRTYIKLWFKKADDSDLLPEQTVYLPQIAGKRFVLDWDYTAGTSFKPVLKIDGKNFCNPGNALPRDQSFVIQYQTKDNHGLVTRPSRKSGTFIYMGFDPYCASVKTIEKAKQEIDALSAQNAQKVLNPSTHEEFLGLMSQVLGETWLNRLHVNSEKTAKYFHGTQIWSVTPIFVYTKYHSSEGVEGDEFYHPIKADPESKFYYHPQWNIDAQSLGSFLKWDHINDRIVTMGWDAPIYQTMRWLAGYGTSYDESKIFEDWMDTPGASTIKGLMLANEDIHGTGNQMLELTASDIQTQTANRTATFETVQSVGSTDPDADWIKSNEAYEGFTFSNVRKVPDGWLPSGLNAPLGSAAISGSYGIAVYNHGDSYCFFARGTKFDLKTIKISGFDNRGTKYRFKAYKRTTNPNATDPFVYANLSKDVILSSTPENVQFNWAGINKVEIIQLTNGNLSMPIVMDNLVYSRHEYIPLLDNQTELHLGYASILNIMRQLDKGGRVITPVQKIYYEGLEGNVYLSHCPGSDLYAFGMDNGGGAGFWTDPNPSFVDTNDYHFDPGLDTFVSNNIYNDLFGGSSQTTVTPTTQVNREQQSWLSDWRASDITLPNPVKNEKKSVLSWVGDPVDSLTGEFYTEEFPDITIKSRGLDLSLVRQYKSQLAYNGPFGFGWAWNHAEKIVPLEGGHVNYYNNQGSVFEIKLKNGAYTYPPGSRFTLKKVTGGYLVTQKESGLKSSFNSNGLLTKREDRFGNTLKYKYTNPDFPGRITLIEDSLDQSLALAYNTNGKCETVTDSNGRAVHYLYDGDDLVEFRGLDYDTNRKSTKFEYLSGQQNDLNNHNMVKYTLPGGDSLRIGYFKNDQVAFHTSDKGETFNFFFSRLSRYTEIWNEEGFYRKIYFNANGDAVRNLAEDGAIEQFEYDDYHNKTAHIDGNGFRTDFQYYPDGTGANAQDGFNAQRKLYKKTNALGHVWKYKYDDPNNPHSPSEIEDPEGRITEFVYNADGSLFKEIRAPGFKFDVQGSGGVLVADASAPGFITEYKYDAFGNVTRVTDALGNTSTTTYDADGRLPVAKTDQNGNETHFAYYEAGNPETMPPDTLKSRTVMEGDETYTTLFEYDALGRKTKETNPLGQATQYQYTIDGKLQKTIYPNGAEAKNVYDTARDIAHGAEIVKKIDALGEFEQYAYNAIGKLIAKTDRNQNKTTYEYDERGRLAKTTDPLGNAETVKYDGSGNVTAKTDKRGLTSTFVYDKANRLVEENLPSGTETEPCIATRTYEYYNDGKKKKQTLQISDGNHENIVTFFE